MKLTPKWPSEIIRIDWVKSFNVLYSLPRSYLTKDSYRSMYPVVNIKKSDSAEEKSTGGLLLFDWCLRTCFKWGTYIQVWEDGPTPLFQDANFPTGKLDPTSSGEVRVTDWVKAILFSILSCVLSKLELPPQRPYFVGHAVVACPSKLYTKILPETQPKKQSLSTINF